MAQTNRERLALYLAAEEKILTAQEYTIGQGSTARRLTRANLAEVQAEIRRLQALVDADDRRRARRSSITRLVP